MFYQKFQNRGCSLKNKPKTSKFYWKTNLIQKHTSNCRIFLYFGYHVKLYHLLTLLFTNNFLFVFNNFVIMKFCLYDINWWQMASVLMRIRKIKWSGIKMGTETFKSPKWLSFDIVSYKPKMTMYFINFIYLCIQGVTTVKSLIWTP